MAHAAGRSFWNGHQRQLSSGKPGDATRLWVQQIPNDGLLRFYMIGNVERLLPTSPKALAEVLVHKAYDWKKTDLIAFTLKKITGQGILLVEGDVHRVQRKNLNPAFSYRHIKELYPVFWEKSIELVQAIEKTVQFLPDGKKIIAVGDWARPATLDIIGLAGMGYNFNCIHDSNNLLQREFWKLLSRPPLFSRLLVFLSLFIYPDLVDYLPLKHTRNAQEASDRIRSFARQLIQERKQKLKTDKRNDNIDIISIALESGGFSDESLVDQVMTFLAAGHETTSTAIQYVIYALCQHPDMQSRLRSEIRSNLPSIIMNTNGAPPTPITAAQIDSLPYLNAVCNEVLRYYPPAPFTVRQAARDTTLLNTFIPKGTVLSISMPAVNRNPELWGPDAETFNPDRWLGPGRANTGGAESNYAFLTFLHGPRSCIGSAFAKGELACVVAAMVGRFEFELEKPDEELEILEGLTIAPKHGVRVKVKVVEGW
ncbi:hypothetical protein PRK78_003586 [Emydomyces testavorans]|uniref:Cytochrome P450 n=1 Tax=Emydomyces testavorans TaxID=2070801 RepID=A0AAF0DGA9_9EURO|nr:hypothetical protein PRK78_003586 [Emydomyces testavorans]